MIRKLNVKTCADIRSGSSISTLHSCVEQLIYNSLDAHSTSITLEIDIPTCSISCQDNGLGIDCEDFKYIGHRLIIR